MPAARPGGGLGPGSIGCSPDKPMHESVDQFNLKFVARAAGPERVAIKPTASRDKEFYVNE